MKAVDLPPIDFFILEQDNLFAAIDRAEFCDSWSGSLGVAFETISDWLKQIKYFGKMARPFSPMVKYIHVRARGKLMNKAAIKFLMREALSICIKCANVSQPRENCVAGFFIKRVSTENLPWVKSYFRRCFFVAFRHWQGLEYGVGGSKKSGQARLPDVRTLRVVIGACKGRCPWTPKCGLLSPFKNRGAAPDPSDFWRPCERKKICVPS